MLLEPIIFRPTLIIFDLSLRRDYFLLPKVAETTQKYYRDLPFTILGLGMFHKEEHRTKDAKNDAEDRLGHLVHEHHDRRLLLFVHHRLWFLSCPMRLFR
jgi:hypothetical protein